ncbi:MAG TPA: phytanoyl-CoA dioxygenase family protein [Roseiflexaceae bacterium]|nr:phytanoyl-CoA dioxygenase family protein [Roseiflexaceae bacterium]
MTAGVLGGVPQVDAGAYEEQGYVLVRQLFDADTVAQMRAEADAMLQRVVEAGTNVEATWKGRWRERLIGGAEAGAAGGMTGMGDADLTAMASAVSSIHNVQYHSAFFMRLLLDERLTGAVAQLIGPDVQLHHTKYHVKPPAVGAPFPMHQDYPFFPHERHTMLAAAIHIDDANVENGCLCVVSGSHKHGPIPHISEGSHYLPLDEWPLERAVPVEARAGDVLLFNYLTVHGSYVNRSARPRRLLLVQMRSPLDRPTAQVHLSPGQGTMLRGINPTGVL